MIAVRSRVHKRGFSSLPPPHNDNAEKVPAFEGMSVLKDCPFKKRKLTTLHPLQVTRLGMFEVHCDELIRGLSKRADTLCSKLLARMSKDHQEANRA